MLEDILAVGVFIDFHAKSVHAALDLRVEEAISKGNLIAKTKFTLCLLQHSLEGVHSPKHPILGKLHFICIELGAHFLQKT